MLSIEALAFAVGFAVVLGVIIIQGRIEAMRLVGWSARDVGWDVGAFGAGCWRAGWVGWRGPRCGDGNGNGSAG